MTPEIPRGLRIARNMDIGLLVAALPIFLLGHIPIAGWAVGAGCYVIQRVVRDVLANKARESGDPRSVAGILVASMLARGFLVALALLGVGLAVSNKAGLSAAVLFLAAFTISFGMGIALRPFEQGPPRV